MAPNSRKDVPVQSTANTRSTILGQEEKGVGRIERSELDPKPKTLDALFTRCVTAGWVRDSMADRLNVYGLACLAHRARVRNPAGLFVALCSRRKFGTITGEDEKKAIAAS